MYTVVETPEFRAQATKVWTTSEYEGFIDFIAANPEAGDVIPGSDGARKVRWAASGHGKRGGARVIYFNLLSDGLVVLIAVYAKAERGNLPTRQIRSAKHGAEKS
ncbi:MAG: transcriptional regulator [Thermomonas sp.]|uniref:transcriptional regulator n=1 Tax=Thermomonas sp. TaxID=1971895 RepID=UPI0039E59285